MSGCPAARDGTVRPARSLQRKTHDPEAPAIQAHDLAAAYDGRVVLCDVSFSLRAGERLAVVGPNGAGKSTLLKVASGLLPAAAGTIRIHGHAPRDHLCVAYVPQRAEIDWRFPLTIADVVLMGRSGRLGPLRRPGRRDRDSASAAIARVGLAPLARRPIGELSGGEQQKMFIARAIAQQADVVLFDEPFAGLDAPAAADVADILSRLEPATIVIAAHDLVLAASFDRVLLVRERMIGFGVPAELLRPDILEQAYGSPFAAVRAPGQRSIADPSGPEDAT